jgi:hypothetical protein
VANETASSKLISRIGAFVYLLLFKVTAQPFRSLEGLNSNAGNIYGLGERQASSLVGGAS